MKKKGFYILIVSTFICLLALILVACNGSGDNSEEEATDIIDVNAQMSICGNIFNGLGNNLKVKYTIGSNGQKEFTLFKMEEHVLIEEREKYSEIANYRLFIYNYVQSAWELFTITEGDNE